MAWGIAMIESTVPWETCLTREVTVLRADLRGVTSVALDLLNRCFSTMSEVIFRHRGTIDKFAGDSILVTFESENTRDDGPRRAVSCAIDMQTAMSLLNTANKAEGLPQLHFGIGINTGRVMSTMLGSDLYSEYSGIGDDVNLASRIESFSLRGQVLVSESTYKRCSGFVKTGDPIEVFVKGKSRLVALREVVSIPSLSKYVPRQDDRRSPRAPATIPFSYRMVVNGVVVPDVREGNILDIGYHGALAEIALPISQASKLQLKFELPLVDERFKELYGKVVKVVKKKKGCTRVGIEFASMTAGQKSAIQRYVQLLIQGIA
jgi:adenylate cyclase